MNKNSLKIFAIEARKELMRKMEVRLKILGINKNNLDIPVILGSQVEVKGNLYSKSSYNKLIEKYKELGYDELIEESAYIWFNRLIALAYMEANKYIDEKMVFSNGSKIEPAIIDEYLEANFFQKLEREEQKKIHELKDKNTLESLEKMYSILVEEKCEELSSIMPFIFSKKGGYSDILFPSGLLMDNSVLVKLRYEIEESKENGLVPIELIGWLYQYYNSEKKNEVFEGLKKNKKITKENIPAATQLFTPKWIVKYMVENSLGKLAIESLGVDSEIKKNWKYYIETEKDINVEKIKIEDIKILDPAMGSGHMLTYSFDILFEIYENLGWSKKDAVLSIMKNNILGLEIDERAAQLASFAIMMKAKEKFPRLFKVLEKLDGEEKFKLNILVIKESNNISTRTRKLIAENSLKNLAIMLDNFYDAKEYGSILKIEDIDTKKLEEEFKSLNEILKNQGQTSMFRGNDILDGNIDEDFKKIKGMIHQQKIMADKYEVVITNPPYMSSSGMDEKLKKYVEKNYKNSKSDMFSLFIEKCEEFTKENMYTSMITMHSWMFLSSFENLRKNIIENTEIQNLTHLGTRAFADIGGEVLQTVAWVSKNKMPEISGNYIRLVDYNSAEWKENEFFNPLNKYKAYQKDFEKIPGNRLGYWLSKKEVKIISSSETMETISYPATGMQTGNNSYYTRDWSEVSINNINFKPSGYDFRDKKWALYQMGGDSRKWYGNLDSLINWKDNGKEVKNEKSAVIRNEKFFFKKGFSWKRITSGVNTIRLLKPDFIFDQAADSVFLKQDKNFLYTMSFFNMKIMKRIFEFIAPTLNLTSGTVKEIPIYFTEDLEVFKKINCLTEKCINISKQEWDFRETSWDFEKLSLIDGENLESAYDSYCNYWRNQFVQMHKNEEELNRIFINIYELQDEMDEKVEFEDITLLKKEATIKKIVTNSIQIEEGFEEMEKTSEGYLFNRGVELEFNKEELVKQFLSYTIGCIMGRYSIDKPGLIIANSDDNLIIEGNKVVIKGTDGEIRHEIEESRFFADVYGIIPVTEEEVFENDIVKKVIEFVKILYGEKNLKKNLEFIAEALGKKKDETAEEVLRKYFIKDFYDDHLQRYKKRPIYWMLNSGKKNSFSCLVYLHRYEENTIARMRTDYLTPYQEIIENQRSYYEKIVIDGKTIPKDKKIAEKKLKELENNLKELREYANEVKHIAEQKIVLDLDDGVKVNYEKFGKILRKI
ncbi:BREX-1 system adenine-specific DNA-methyltransferase PglX [Fusobacterium ulcerans]|uniref:site-specific DNA-methyltransferase (adenine-specific) n=1 Tax=Fusobacterium ulcerans TaxID=861 RepID=A0AAX2JEB5_9FUSO|nr:BREX-1 system adenine-specific DNA-methyltransferase PglX [Fusobacterium ulcerans]AVQ27161.1 BREX-1 system adenine-specific DNA-methyltransferase PglX [Fusobacterium ulcerans]EFS24709.1 hypothetical protein FUAG_00224 [Fusobacterium ulcerans ATCC 49185]SQJ11059.1 Eco57I restriction-modification methylase [Fusobacterium ulcerans]